VTSGSQWAALLGLIAVDHSGAGQIRCQPAVLEGLDRVPESRGRGHQLAMRLMQD
jgi:hypothetical protein